VSSSLVAQAVKAAGKDQPVVLKANVSDNSSSVAVKLTAKNLKTLSAGSGAGVTLQSPAAKITLDGEALEQVRGDGKQDATISFRKLTKSDLSKKAAEAVGSAPVYDLSVTSGRKAVSDLGKGSVQVTIPYSGKAGSDLLMCRVEEDGSLTPVAASALVGGEMVFRVDHPSAYALVENTSQFQDTKTHWARGDVAFSAGRGIVEGVGGGDFQPDAPVTVAAAVTVLGRLSGVADASDAADWAKPHLAWARESDLLPDGLDPNAPISREALAYLLAHYMGGGESAKVDYVDLDSVDPEYLSSIQQVRAWA